MLKIEINKNSTGWKPTMYFANTDSTPATACKRVRAQMKAAGEFDERDTVKLRAIRE